MYVGLCMCGHVYVWAYVCVGVSILLHMLDFLYPLSTATFKTSTYKTKPRRAFFSGQKLMSRGNDSVIVTVEVSSSTILTIL